jgi:excisionase family DNA binding protein
MTVDRTDPPVYRRTEAKRKDGRGVEKLLYRPGEAADLCSVGRTTIFNALKDGSLESVKLGAARRIPREALMAFVEKLRVQN